MNAPLNAHAVARELDLVENKMLDVLVGRFNQEIKRALQYIEPGSSFEVSVSEPVEIAAGKTELPTKIVMNAVADAFRNQGWAVEAALQGHGFGAVSMVLVRPPRGQPLIPTVSPIDAFDLANSNPPSKE